jgi:hypothetical protein
MAIVEVGLPDAARLRSELGRGLSCAAALAALGPGISARQQGHRTDRADPRAASRANVTTYPHRNPRTPMADPLEQELRRLIVNFVADVQTVIQRAALRSVQAAFDGVPVQASRAVAIGAAAVPARRPVPRRSRTADELASVRAQLATLIREQPDRTTAELARAIGIPSNSLRPQLHQLADEGVIRVDQHVSSGLRRYTYRAAEPAPVHHAEAPVLAAGAAA